VTPVSISSGEAPRKVVLTVMIGMSIVLSIHLHRETSISSRGVLW
jgi:hypothetical protein